MDVVRTCVVCRKQGAKLGLLRFVLCLDRDEVRRIADSSGMGEIRAKVIDRIRLDVTGTLPSRGAYIHPHITCLSHRGALIRVFVALLGRSSVTLKGSKGISRIIEKIIREVGLSMSGVVDEALKCMDEKFRHFEGQKVKAETLNTIMETKRSLSVLKRKATPNKESRRQFRIRL